MPKPRIFVGVKYLPGHPAPHILFKAQGDLGRRVEALAQRYHVPLHENSDLAPLLYQLPEGSWIPEKHFDVLAQLLAAVYHGIRPPDESHTSPRK